MSEWKKYIISELCTDIIDCVNKTAPISDKETPYRMLRTSDIRDGFINLDGLNCVTEDVFQKWTRRGVLQVGDIVFTREAPLGEVGIVREAVNYFLGQRLVLYRANPQKCDNRFLMYWFLNPINKEGLKSRGVGATVTHLRVPECERIEITAPDISTQRRIAAILSAYDDLIENNRRQIALLEEAAQRLYKEWFVDLRFPGHEHVPIVDGLPEGWKWSKVTDLLAIKYGKDHKSLDDGEIPVYGSGGVMRKVKPVLYSGESVLIPRKGSLNNILYVDCDFWTIDTMFYSIPRIKNVVKYSYLTLSSKDMYSFNIGAAVPSMTTKILDSMDILLPDESILSKFEETVASVFDKVKILNRQSYYASEARDRLLPKLMSGEIEV